MFHMLLIVLLGGVWIAAGTWILLPKELRRVAMRPPSSTWILIAVLAVAYLLGGYFFRGHPSVLVVPVAVLASPAVLLLGMAQRMREWPAPGADTSRATVWTGVAVGATGLGIAGFGVNVFVPTLWISMYAGIHVVAFARGWRTPWNDRAMTALSFGLAVFWFALPVLHVRFDVEDPGVTDTLGDLGVRPPNYIPDCRTGFPFRRILGHTGAAASEHLPADRGLPWMLVNAACCVAGAWLALLPVPSRTIRILVFPALVSACACAVAGIAYMLYVLD